VSLRAGHGAGKIFAAFSTVFQIPQASEGRPAPKPKGPWC